MPNSIRQAERISTGILLMGSAVLLLGIFDPLENAPAAKGLCAVGGAAIGMGIVMKYVIEPALRERQ